MADKFYNWINEAPFAGKVLTSKSVNAIREKDPVKKDIKIEKRLLILLFLIFMHAIGLYPALLKTQKSLQKINSISFPVNQSEMQMEIVGNAVRIAYVLANFFVVLAQINLFIRLSKIKHENKIKMINLLEARFGIKEGEVFNISEFINGVLQELELEPDKRIGLNTIIYLLTKKEKENIRFLLNINKLPDLTNIQPGQIASYFENSNQINPDDLNIILNPKTRQNLIQKFKHEYTPSNMTSKEIYKALTITFIAQITYIKFG